MLRIRRWFSLALVLSAVFAIAAVGQDEGNKGKKPKGKDKDDVVGTIWHYTLTRGDKKDTGQFRVKDLEIFKGKNKIGVIKPKDDDESSFKITELPELNGTAEIRKVRRNSPVWKGTLTKANGTKWDIEIEVKDR
jgi:hypothetical protein